MVETSFRLVFEEGFMDIPVSYNAAMPTDDETVPLVPGTLSVYPNPFSGSCGFSYKGSSREPVKLEIFNLRGQRVFVADQLSATQINQLIWNGQNENKQPCGSGIYLYRLSGTNTRLSGKLLKLK